MVCVLSFRHVAELRFLIYDELLPPGSLTTGKGNRFVLANTEALHEKINILANRVRHLEDALSESHALTAHTAHPLLSEELLQIKRPLERERLDVPTQEEKPETEDTIDSLGSLSISNDGRSTFFGQTANSWIEGDSDDDEDSLSNGLQSPGPTDLSWLSHAFPFAAPVGKTAESVRQTIVNKLPQLAEARALSDIYYHHAAYTPITAKDFNEMIFRHVYDTERTFEPLTAQQLAVFCMVLALGALLDLDKPAHSPEAMQYYHLGRAALSIDSVLEEQSITGIQALVGLHRDSGRWKLDSEQTNKRRNLFYELLTYDSWQSLTFGRPPSLSTAHIDNQLPPEPMKKGDGEPEMDFAAWKHRYSAQCLSVVHDQAFGARTPNYRVIQDLDRKVRAWYVPPNLQVPGFGSAKIVTSEVEQPTVELTMQRYIAFAIKEMTLFYMHRGFFAQALEDNPVDPMGSKYSPSVLAAYTSATTFVGLVESLFNQHPQLTERMWFLFTHVFSCAIVLGSIAAKSQMALSRSALSHLDSAYNLFSRVSDHARAGKILPILHKLKDRAHMAQSNVTLPTLSETATRLAFYGPKIKSEVDELSALGGMTRLVSRRSSSSPSVSAPSPTSQHSSPPIISESQVYLPQQEASSSSGWQNYTHIQNFNVNINMPGEYYPTSMPVTPNSQQNTPPDITMLYQMPGHMPTHHHQHPHHQTQSIPIDMGAHDAYYMNGYGPGYVNGNGGGYLPSHMQEGPSPHDLQDSWQNFMAQYKP
ncbi:hypothetical protein NLJ89_g1555 [Agrocybe chaxingu]|uniref:Xylanolytic transcriptional activator regulatory domain-containing protein n=1 Tax=Agrocybe chaxingu TaxID=84603 RepID=A0A9W8TF09_9AGAR|nr:hypothetical protein NLJ89_g1555 [Agrocybe chaxingu]